MIQHLPTVVPYPAGQPREGNEAHPMRLVSRELARDPASWTAARRAEVAALFDSLASEWTDRYEADPHRLDALVDALDRAPGLVPTTRGARCLDVASGTGVATGLLGQRLGRVIALDVSAAMLASSPAAAKVRADAAAVPLATGSIDVVVLMNAFLFAAEMDRVLAPAGRLLWVSTWGPDTPIWLPVDEVVAALPGPWEGVAGAAGPGTWAVLHRAVPIPDEPDRH